MDVHYWTSVFDGDLTIPFDDLFLSLGIFVAALIVGIAMGRWTPRAAEIVNKLHKGFSIIYVLYICILGSYVNLYAFEFLADISVLFSGMMLPWIGTLISGVVAYLFRQPWNRVKTIAIETAIQNAAISLVLLDRCFEEPTADIASVMPIASFLFTPIPLIIAVAVKFKANAWILPYKFHFLSLQGTMKI